MVHFGLNHIGFNMMAQLLFGTPIERVHGTYRIMLLYQLGVFGSSLFAGWTDPMKIVVGASGGVYTILGAHWANMAISWSAMKNGTVPPIARMIVLSSLVGIDVVQYLFYRAGGTSCESLIGLFLYFPSLKAQFHTLIYPCSISFAAFLIDSVISPRCGSSRRVADRLRGRHLSFARARGRLVRELGGEATGPNHLCSPRRLLNLLGL